MPGSGAQQRSDPDAAAELVDVLAGLVELGEDAAGAGGDRESGLGRRDAVAGALEQHDAELTFEPRTWWDSADWARWSSSAARVKCRWPATRLDAPQPRDRS